MELSPKTILMNDASAQADRLGIQDKGEHFNSRDAFRHAYTAAKMVILARSNSSDNSLFVEAIKAMVNGSGHVVEFVVKESIGSHAMDVHNNAVGVDIGADLPIDATDDDIAEAVHEAMKRGELILRPGDEREGWYDYQQLFNLSMKRIGMNLGFTIE